MGPAPELDEALDAFRRGDLDRARALAEMAVAGEPSAQSQHLLGLIHCRQGDPASGVEWLLRACGAEPDNLGFRVIASRALIDAGRSREVLAMEEPPPVTSPAAMALWQARGEAADAVGDRAASSHAWEKVAAAAPSDWRAWGNLGDALAAQGRWDEAAPALARAVRLNSGEMTLWRNLAAALASAQRHADVLGLADEWRRVAGANAAQAILRGGALAALERYDEAEEAYRQAAEMAPKDAAAWTGLGLVYERTGKSERLGELIEDANAAGVTAEQLGFVPVVHALNEGRIDEAKRLLDAVDRSEDPIRWYRLKSRIDDRAGKFAEAFAAAEAMNRSARDFDGWVRRGAEYRARLRSLAEAAGPTAQCLPPAAMTPVFLVGFPRSGTTLLDTFLMGHSRIKVLEELPLIMEAEKICPVAQAASASAETLERARNVYLSALAGHVDPGFDGVVVDKMPLNMLAVPLIRALFPDARFIFAQRHPCDAVLSGFMQSFLASEPMASFLTIDGAADFYDAAMSLWTRSTEVLPGDFHTTVYEELVDDPEAAMKSLVEFLGLSWEDALLDHRSSARSRGAIVTPSYDQVVEPLSKRAVGRWTDYRDQLGPVLPTLRPWAERLGYPD